MTAGQVGSGLSRRALHWLASVGLRRAAICALLAGSALALWVAARPAYLPLLPPTFLALLLPDEGPDGAADDDPAVLAWRDAAAEIGFPLVLVRASQLLRGGVDLRAAALILPDTVHRRMNDGLLAHLDRLVRDGSRLMLVFDAGMQDLNGSYHPQQSRLSALAGVRYGLYGALGTGMLRQQVAWVDAEALPLLHLPPGKLVRRGGQQPLTSAQPAPQPDEALAVVGYHYGRLRYPVFATDGAFDGRRLMHADGADGGSVGAAPGVVGASASLLAGVHRLGRGEVLFVNLPLTFLKLRTDGLFLHSFLRYFAQDLARLPQLSPMPDGRGALVMNWHIDSAAAVPAMDKLARLGAFEQGPYSVHLTAGPDVDVPGDGLGMDLAGNPAMQQWVRHLVDRGDEIGGHGGWIHNEFGRLIGTQDAARSAQMIERNSQAISSASGQPVREYSAPTGNHPAWVTPWLRERGVRAYYFTGDIGMAPTHSYQDGQRGPDDMWAFPVLSYGSDAAFEEAAAHHVQERDIGAWLKDVADFCADQRTVRLVYFHPPGIALFPQAFAHWLTHTKTLLASERLRWMTMVQYADFANRRLQVQWQVLPAGANPGNAGNPASAGNAAQPTPLRLQASHPSSLAHITWLLPAQRYGPPQVLQGSALVVREGAFWRVTAGAGPQLMLGLVTLPVLASSAPAPTAAPASATATVSPSPVRTL